MSKCKVHPTLVVAVVVSLTGLARASLIDFHVAGPSTATWNSTGAVITHRISSSPAVVTMTAEFAPPSSGVSSAAASYYSTFKIHLIVGNNSDWTWTGYLLDLSPKGDAYFVPGSYSCPDFCEPVEDGGVAEPIHLEFERTPGDPGVLPGESTDFYFDICVLGNGSHTFELNVLVPEPATLALLGTGALALVSRRRTT